MKNILLTFLCVFVSNPYIANAAKPKTTTSKTCDEHNRCTTVIKDCDKAKRCTTTTTVCDQNGSCKKTICNDDAEGGKCTTRTTTVATEEKLIMADEFKKDCPKALQSLLESTQDVSIKQDALINAGQESLKASKDYTAANDVMKKAKKEVDDPAKALKDEIKEYEKFLKKQAEIDAEASMTPEEKQVADDAKQQKRTNIILGGLAAFKIGKSVYSKYIAPKLSGTSTGSSGVAPNIPTDKTPTTTTPTTTTPAPTAPDYSAGVPFSSVKIIHADCGTEAAGSGKCKASPIPSSIYLECQTSSTTIGKATSCGSRDVTGKNGKLVNFDLTQDITGSSWVAAPLRKNLPLYCVSYSGTTQCASPDEGTPLSYLPIIHVFSSSAWNGPCEIRSIPLTYGLKCKTASNKTVCASSAKGTPNVMFHYNCPNLTSDDSGCTKAPLPSNIGLYCISSGETTYCYGSKTDLKNSQYNKCSVETLLANY